MEEQISRLEVSSKKVLEHFYELKKENEFLKRSLHSSRQKNKDSIVPLSVEICPSVIPTQNNLEHIAFESSSRQTLNTKFPLEDLVTIVDRLKKCIKEVVSIKNGY